MITSIRLVKPLKWLTGKALRRRIFRTILVLYKRLDQLKKLIFPDLHETREEEINNDQIVDNEAKEWPAYEGFEPVIIHPPSAKN